MRSLFTLWILLTATGASWGQVGPSEPPERADPPSAWVLPDDGRLDPAEVARQLSLEEATLLNLAPASRRSLPLRLVLPLEGSESTLYLVPHSVRSTAFRVTEHLPDGTYRDVDPGPVNTFRGFVFGEPGALVAGGLSEEGIHATILYPDGKRLWLEPIVTRVAGARQGDHVLYDSERVIPGGARCTAPVVSPSEGKPSPAEGGGGGAGARPGDRFILELAVDAEYQFYFDYGSTIRTAQRSELIIATMSLQFERELNIYFVLTRIIVRTSQILDYSNPARNFRLQTREIWAASHADVPRDIIVLLDGNGLGGQAALDSICSDWAIADVGVGGYPLLDHSTDTTAHEVGHILGATHCPCGSPPYTMNASISQANRFAGAPLGERNKTSIEEIKQFRDAGLCFDHSGGGGIVSNDFFCSAVTLGEWTWGFSTLYASTDGPPGSCATPENDIWYFYDAPCDGTVSVETCMSDFDTSLTAYRGASCPHSFGEEVACNEDSVVPGCRSGQSVMTFDTRRGERYLLRVGGYQGATGSGLLLIRQSPCQRPSNDNCLEVDNLIHLDNSIPQPFSTTGATTDGGLETRCNAFDDAQIANDIWFRYVAPCAGPLRVSLCGSDFDTKLGVYRGCFADEDRSVACNDDDGPACMGMTSSVEFPVEFAGSVYLFRVGGYFGATGTGTILATSLSCAPAPKEAIFRRGDGNSDGSVNISDPIATLGHLFLGSPRTLHCQRSADVDDSGAVNITDAVYLLSFLFLGTAPPPPPFDACGSDTTSDPLACTTQAACTP